MTSPRQSLNCGICGHQAVIPEQHDLRDSKSCAACGSTLRFRNIIGALGAGLSMSGPLSKWPQRKEVSGIGITDAGVYANFLADVFSYKNTFYHKDPRIDITAKPESDKINSFDFIICSDVLEHVIGPISQALDGLAQMLRPGGFVIITVPLKQGATIEHYPGLVSFNVNSRRTRSREIELCFESGRRELDPKPIFHGGDGATLELRVIGLSDLRHEIEASGLTFHVEFSDSACPVIVGRKPGILIR